jgi:hypothetical protein
VEPGKETLTAEHKKLVLVNVGVQAILFSLENSPRDTKTALACTKEVTGTLEGFIDEVVRQAKAKNVFRVGHSSN